MRFQRPLNVILDSEHRVRILRFLCHKGGEWIGRRLATELAMNPVTAHRALRNLHQSTILDFRKVGTHFLYSLRDNHYLVREVLRPLFEREAKARQRLVEVLRSGLSPALRRHMVTAAIYGSIARGQEQPASDVDLLVLVNSEQDKQIVRAALDRLGGTVMQTFGNPLTLYINTVREAQRKTRHGLPLFKNILNEHQLVFGKPLQEALRGRKA
mgnify:FL=1